MRINEWSGVEPQFARQLILSSHSESGFAGIFKICARLLHFLPSRVVLHRLLVLNMLEACYLDTGRPPREPGSSNLMIAGSLSDVKIIVVCTSHAVPSTLRVTA